MCRRKVRRQLDRLSKLDLGFRVLVLLSKLYTMLEMFESFLRYGGPLRVDHFVAKYDAAFELQIDRNGDDLRSRTDRNIALSLSVERDIFMCIFELITRVDDNLVISRSEIAKSERAVSVCGYL
jgi:hypothetical protein